MRLTAIVAMSENHVIGYKNKLPWHLPADMHRFKTLTLGKPIIMGRTTYESIGRPLPERCNIVITRDTSFQAPGCVVANSIEGALAAADYSEEVVVIGGAKLYAYLLPRIQRIYMTIIHHDFNGDTYFPELNMQEWRESERELYEPDDKNAYSYTFITLDRQA